MLTIDHRSNSTEKVRNHCPRVMNNRLESRYIFLSSIKVLKNLRNVTFDIDYDVIFYRQWFFAP